MNKKLSLAKKRSIFGLCLLIPFILGFVLFFLFPFIESLRYSFSEISMSAGAGGTEIKNAGLSNYIRLFNSDVKFRELLFQNLNDMFIKVPMIVVYSIFIAVMLNKPFKGRDIARTVFFLPVLTTAGIVLQLEINDLLLMSMQGTNAANVSESVSIYSEGIFDIKSLLMNMNIDYRILNYLSSVVDKLYDIIISSGVQVVLLLAAIQSIPKSLYEASAIEGSNAWEDFWKITVPIIGPYIILCVVYSIIDSFTSASNVALQHILEVAYRQLDYGFASAMAWIYFAVIAVILAVILIVFTGSRLVFSYERSENDIGRKKKPRKGLQ